MNTEAFRPFILLTGIVLSLFCGHLMHGMRECEVKMNGKQRTMASIIDDSDKLTHQSIYTHIDSDTKWGKDIELTKKSTSPVTLFLHIEQSGFTSHEDTPDNAYLYVPYDPYRAVSKLVYSPSKNCLKITYANGKSAIRSNLPEATYTIYLWAFKIENGTTDGAPTPPGVSRNLLQGEAFSSLFTLKYLTAGTLSCTGTTEEPFCKTITCPTTDIVSCATAATECLGACVGGHACIDETTSALCAEKCPVTTARCKTEVCAGKNPRCLSETLECPWVPPVQHKKATQESEYNWIFSATGKDIIEILLDKIEPGRCVRIRQKKNKIASETISVTIDEALRTNTENDSSFNPRPLYKAPSGFTLHSRRISGDFAYFAITDDISGGAHPTFTVNCLHDSCDKKLTILCHKYRKRGDYSSSSERVDCSKVVDIDLFTCDHQPYCPPESPSIPLAHAWDETLGQNYISIEPHNLGSNRCIVIKSPPVTGKNIYFQVEEKDGSPLKDTAGGFVGARGKTEDDPHGGWLAKNVVALYSPGSGDLASNIYKLTGTHQGSTELVKCIGDCPIRINCHDDNQFVDCSTHTQITLFNCDDYSSISSATKARVRITEQANCKAAPDDCPSRCKECDDGDELICDSDCERDCSKCTPLSAAQLATPCTITNGCTTPTPGDMVGFTSGDHLALNLDKVGKKPITITQKSPATLGYKARMYYATRTARGHKSLNFHNNIPEQQSFLVQKTRGGAILRAGYPRGTKHRMSTRCKVPCEIFFTCYGVKNNQWGQVSCGDIVESVCIGTPEVP